LFGPLFNRLSRRPTRPRRRPDAAGGRTIDEPLLRELYAHWQARRADRPLPRRRDIDPVDIAPAILPYLAIVEPVEAGRFRYRLAGTRVVEGFGMEMTGRHLDELLRGEHLAFVQGLYRRVLETGKPLLVQSSHRMRRRTDLVARKLMLPIADQSGAVGQVLTALIWRYSGLAPLTPEIFELGMTGNDCVLPLD
jgi:hypothetical protein